MVKNNLTNEMQTPAAEMAATQLQGMRRWPAHISTEQMRQQIAWEQSPDFRLAA